MVRLIGVVCALLLAAMLYASCSSPVKTIVDGETEQERIQRNAEVQIAAENAALGRAESQDMLNAAISANNANAMNTQALVSAILSLGQQNTAFAATVMQNSQPPQWILTLVIVAVVAMVLFGGFLAYSTWRMRFDIERALVAHGAIAVLPRKTSTQRRLESKGIQYTDLGDGHLLVQKGSESVKVVNE